ncbi:hypothetical protein [Aurantimonas marianensis]|uniref:Uncharacterized protein n=1 Tax=Aurantimonas marianensis TaxID=2920428 RepID=A0A9X2H613_9HYPH|nr:hypothetical protein [Aurantimonas marianensis]MCP3054500.1 hypothetical protein [Aurantimonas marianensis]
MRFKLGRSETLTARRANDGVWPVDLLWTSEDSVSLLKLNIETALGRIYRGVR